MTTALDIIKSSLRLIRVLDAGETPSAADAQDCLFALNMMLGSWAAQPNAIYQSTEIVIPIVQGTGDYTVSTATTVGDIPYRVTKIEDAYIRDQGGTDLPLEIWTESQYESIPNKSQQGQPIIVNYVREDKVRLWPVPVMTYDLRLTAYTPFTQLTLNSTIMYPVEYGQAVRYSLARQLAPEYGADWTPDMEGKYLEAIGVMKAMNLSQTLSPQTFDLPTSWQNDVWFRRMNFPS